MQRNWIGKSVGGEGDFKVEGSDETIRIFTTRPDTLFGVTFMSLAAGHPMIEKITTADRKADVEKFSAKAKAEAKAMRMNPEEVEKEGVFTGAYCLNPLTGIALGRLLALEVVHALELEIAHQVVAHDQRDFEF